ncbi:uncharacterized protein EURHEDRAFT_357003 [Aspergillus ruber CBS 135680]|uniref:Myb-like DNA-binding domain-containing protein n=1 Tax=Aspergillus ruber (strain CBS 135680) TaxID=1388766 RepID=A0A017SJY3_ASPRC|nr:uncharacterized protein EURHEDRAFT_357003 [Aspergillus ruber CBS 135680]EYE96610.1 hypothetical protein EURHEDRAFT_357003 [Aspergillus ruber CBS 135680]
MSDYTQERLRSLLYRTQKKKGPLMPPPVYPVTIDDNLVFLWRAIQHSNYTKIDFNLLGNDFQLNREEALECFRELRRAIEDAVYNNYMERSNDRRESAGPTNILGLAVRRRKETVEDAEVIPWLLDYLGPVLRNLALPTPMHPTLVLRVSVLLLLVVQRLALLVLVLPKLVLRRLVIGMLAR